MLPRFLAPVSVLCLALGSANARAQDAALPELPDQDIAPNASQRGSIVEDRAARKLLDAGDARLEADEPQKALEIWESVIERFPRSRHRFDAHLRIGDHLLDAKGAFDEARPHFEAAAHADNPSDQGRGEALLKAGICRFEARDFAKAFQVFRDVLEAYPSTDFANRAHYYIGLGHFQLGHFSRAIEALEKVGTAFAPDDPRLLTVEAGRRLFIRIEDQDLAILEPGEGITVVCRSKVGDEESVLCLPTGRNAPLVVGSIPTKLGPATPGNGTLEVQGSDAVAVTYADRHSSAGARDEQRVAEIRVVGSATAQIMDGPFLDPIDGVVLGKAVNVQVIDSDRDSGAQADTITATLEILRRKSDDEIEAELAVRTAAQAAGATAGADEQTDPPPGDPREAIDRFRTIASGTISLTEVPSGTTSAVHSGIFRATIPLSLDGAGADYPTPDHAGFSARSGDVVRITYADERNLAGESQLRVAEAACVEGDLGDVKVTRTTISDRELNLRTRLRTADALTRIGNHYREFGLPDRAGAKYREALEVCGEIEADAREIGGSALEETYAQLWRIYFAMDELDLALIMSRRLLEEFPQSRFVDEAMLQEAHVARDRGDFARAIGLYSTVLKLRQSSLRGDAQFGIAECTEEMALAAPPEQANAIFERAFVEYSKVYEQFPESGHVGEAVAKMANFYYQKKDYTRAIDVFETVFREHPDAEFLDVILFNYGRCLYRLDRKAEARRQFDRLLAEFPESRLAAEARQIADALGQTGI